jgi:CRP-like cAMP-binding protein
VAGLEFLRRIDWLQELGEPDWSELGRCAVRLVFARGETVFEPARSPQSVYLLEQGRIRIFRLSAQGKEATLGYVEPGGVFGELAVFGEYSRESFALAQRDSVVWQIPVSVFRGWIRERPMLVAEVARQIGERMKRVESRIEGLVLHDVRSRLATVLLELTEDFSRGGDERRDIDLSQGELATLIGASRQSVNATLAQFQDDGLVRRDGRGLRLLEVERLRRLSEAGSD